MKPMPQADHRLLLRAMFDAAVASAQPARCLAPHLPAPPRGRTIVIGAGKASAAMAQALEAHWPGPLEGLVITRYGYAVPCERVEIVEAAHPVPDAAGLQATARMRRLVSGLTEDDLVIALISGGGSSLLVAPGEGLTLADKQAVNAALLQCGATIAEMNCVRRHLSAVKGGRLAAACHPARVVTLMISDVPGDHPIDIASGPTVADPTTRDDALAVLARYRVAVPASVLAHLRGDAAESIKPGDARLRASTVRLITAPQIALEAAARVARAAGYTPHILGDSLEGRRAISASSWPAWPGRWRGAASRSRRRACCCLAARPPSRSGATAGAAATWSSCCRWRWRSTGCPACTPSRATPMVWTASKRSPAPASRPTRSPGRGHSAFTRARASTTTTATASSRPWATRSSPVRR